MKKVLPTAALLIAIFGVTYSTSATDRQDPNVKGRVFSASATISPGSDRTIVADIPTGAAFLLTQVCAGGAPSMGLMVVGSVSVPVSSSFEACTTYVPGVLLESGPISCVMDFPIPPEVDQGLVCMVTGFMNRRTR